MKKMSKHTKSKKKYLLIALAVILVASGVLFALEKTGTTNFIGKDAAPVESGVNRVNYNPPTEEERQVSETQKDQTIKEEAARNSAGTPDPTDKGVNVVITDAGQYGDTIEVRSFVSNHYQDGTCTITFTQGPHTVQKTTAAYRDASTTICTNPLFKRTEFPTSGDWKVTVTYKSEGATGTASQTIKIQ